MIERHIPFTVDEQKRADFERFFVDRYLPPAAQMPGFISLALLRSQAQPSEYRMTFRWTDAPSAAGWRVSAIHEGLQPELRALAEMGEILVFDVVD
jgi:heme-degrading monooxygenase HmoA